MEIKKKISIKIEVNAKDIDNCDSNCRFFVDNGIFRNSCTLFSKWLTGCERCEKCIKAFGTEE